MWITIIQYTGLSYDNKQYIGDYNTPRTGNRNQQGLNGIEGFGTLLMWTGVAYGKIGGSFMGSQHCTNQH